MALNLRIVVRCAHGFCFCSYSCVEITARRVDLETLASFNILRIQDLIYAQYIFKYYSNKTFSVA